MPVVNVVDNFRMVLGRWMSVVVMPYLTPLSDWMEVASSEALLCVVASICEVRCAFFCSVLAAALVAVPGLRAAVHAATSVLKANKIMPGAGHTISSQAWFRRSPRL